MPIDTSFLKKLEEKYCASKNGAEAWAIEKERIPDILAKIEKDVMGRYVLESPINIGGAGIVIKVTDSVLGIPRALKCARPVAGKEPQLNDIIASEIARLIESSHSNIISIGSSCFSVGHFISP